MLGLLIRFVPDSIRKPVLRNWYLSFLILNFCEHEGLRSKLSSSRRSETEA